MLWAASAGVTPGNPAITDRRYRSTDRKAKSQNRKAENQDRKAEFGNPKSKIQNLKSDSLVGGTSNFLASPETSYSTFFGGSGLDIATGVAVDAAGSVYVTGYTNSFDFPSSAPGLSLRGGGTCGDGLDA